MTEHKNLAQALAAFQGEMPTVHKGKTAKVPMKSGGSYSYKYADLADVAAAVHPVLARHGLSFTSLPRKTEAGYELVAQLWHASGENIEGALPLRGSTPQEWGSSLTYMRRYLLGCLTGVVTDDDEDGQAASRAPANQGNALTTAARSAAKRETRKQVGHAEPTDTGEAMKSNTRGRLFALLADAPGLADEDQQRTFMGDTIGHEVTSRADLTDAEGRQIIARLEAWQKGEPGAAWAPQAVNA